MAYKMFEKRMREILLRVLSYLKIPSLLRASEKRKGNYVALFHGIHKKKYNGIPSSAQNEITIKQFEATLDWLEKRFTFRVPEELFDPDKKGGILLTFDDGFMNNLSNALPILEKRGIPALFFITTQHVVNPSNWLWFARERALSYWDSEAEVPKEMAEELYDGIGLENLKKLENSPVAFIGAHSVSHPDLPDLDSEKAGIEILESKGYLENHLRRKIDYFAYPRGLFSEDSVRICEAHFKAAFAVDVFDSSVFKIPRVSLHSADPAYLDNKFSPLHKPSFRYNGK